ncbi:BolA family protein [Thorsellia anophelis]|uniref:Acid stress-induced BolA-like protein IbaG/YrbA, predicted regulator of iron metabolism n=1 Tax=Thorsellia anophelis DSM 18579 TaxID=1123402 RepID=A0A1I0AA37_9GAMM|nr:BolA family protein [Thorsellia anophelis]SES90556.1 Acid stress-induced BolA-like protein IbaG/YrbA, predicted regulator of iron metabolism [Thorsellia anophelis DSM 18579]
MDNAQITEILKNALELDEVYVNGDGSHFNVIAVGKIFEEITLRVKQQQYLYGPLMPFIADNSIHAVNFKIYTPDVWQRERKLMGM